MTTHRKSVNYNGEVEETKRKGKNSKKKSFAFARLGGPSQSVIDRGMNNRSVRPPKNINLVEGDPIEKETIQRKRQVRSFPDEDLLSSRIKEANGLDYSNEFIEQHYRQFLSESVSSEINEDLTSSSSITNDSMQSRGCEDCSTEIESLNTEAELAGNFSDNVHGEYKADDCDEYDPHFIDTEEITDFIRNCRYSKNAAIIGLLKNKIISVDDLETDIANKLNFYSEDDLEDIHFSLSNESLEKNDKSKEKNREDPEEMFVARSNGLENHPHLVPHPDDPEFYAHPLQAYGEVDDKDVDYRISRLGEKTIMTSRQFFINQGMDDEIFAFQSRPAVVPKPKLNINCPNVNYSKSPTTQNRENRSAVPDESYIMLSDNEEEEFVLQNKDFPTL